VPAGEDLVSRPCYGPPMTRRTNPFTVAALLLVTACGGKSEPAPDNAQSAAPPQTAFSPAEKALLSGQPLQDAIHRALSTGENQRWSFAGMSGWAVPSPVRAANGCRAVRYSVDQRPTESYRPVNACEGSR